MKTEKSEPIIPEDEDGSMPVSIPGPVANVEGEITTDLEDSVKNELLDVEAETTAPNEGAEYGESVSVAQDGDSTSDGPETIIDSLLSVLVPRIDGTQKEIEGIAKQLSFLPKQIRNLSSKVDGIGAVISDSNFRSLLLGVLGIFDLSEQMLRTLPETDGVEGRRCLDTLSAQLQQILEANGVSRVQTDGLFDPSRHRAIDSSETDDRSLNDVIKEEVRTGFSSGERILRFAEVVVWKFVPNDSCEEKVDEKSASAMENE